jgi:Response regulator containing a CheY-like receiver domain and an HTH DNA-binding domain
MDDAKPRDVELATRRLQYEGTCSHILFIAEPGAIFEGLAEIIKKELPGYTTEVRQSLVGESPPTALVFVQASALRDPVPMLAAIRSRFMRTPVTLVLGQLDQDLHRVEDIVMQRLVQGVLSLAQPIAIWNAAIRLLLSGEEYFPASVLHQNFRRPDVETSAVHAFDARSAGHPGSADVLTPREHQVLDYMSKGYQNKIIAARLCLSEHTVKIHVRNVIRKLRVHNRTQAASAYLGTLAGRSSAGLGSGPPGSVSDPVW